jgi:hypothetical protein
MRKWGEIVMVFKCLREESIYNVGASLYRQAAGRWDQRSPKETHSKWRFLSRTTHYCQIPSIANEVPSPDEAVSERSSTDAYVWLTTHRHHHPKSVEGSNLTAYVSWQAPPRRRQSVSPSLERQPPHSRSLGIS